MPGPGDDDGLHVHGRILTQRAGEGKERLAVSAPQKKGNLL
jgi:hypothetical protein